MSPESLEANMNRLEAIEDQRIDLQRQKREITLRLGELANEAWGIRCDMVTGDDAA